MRCTRLCLSGATAVLSVAMLTTPLHATERLWIGPDGGLFIDFKNWNPSGVPSGGDFALFDEGSPNLLNVLFFSDPPTHIMLTVRQGQIQLDLAGHTYSTTSTLVGVIVGDTAFSEGALTVNTGVMDCDNAIVGFVADSVGELHLLPSTQWLATGVMFVGYFGEGLLDVNGPDAQSLLSTQGGNIGFFAGSDGTVTIEGTFGQWTNVGDLTIGDGGNGSLKVSDFGTVSTTVLTTIGDQASGLGELIVSGPGSSLTSGSAIHVGNEGTGSMTVEGGALVDTSSNCIVGVSAGSSGAVLVTGTGSELHCTGTVEIGQIGVGSVIVADGGTVDAINSVTVHPDGHLYGDGVVDTVFAQNAGFVGPGVLSGDLTGTLIIDANYAQLGTGTLGIELSGTGAGEYDVLDISGFAELSGTLAVAFVDGFVPSVGDAFVVLTAGSVDDEFVTLDAPVLPDGIYCLSYGAVSVTLLVVSSADLTCDGMVNVVDLLNLLAGWGTIEGDVTGDGTTDVLDLLALLAEWGA